MKVALMVGASLLMWQHFRPSRPYTPSRPYSPPRAPSRPYTPSRPSYRPPAYHPQQQQPIWPAPQRPWAGGGGSVVAVPTQPSTPFPWGRFWLILLAIGGGVGSFMLVHWWLNREPLAEPFGSIEPLAMPVHPVWQKNTFTCVECRGVFPVVRTEQEARDEAAVLYGSEGVDESGAVCDDCFKKYRDEAYKEHN